MKNEIILGAEGLGYKTTINKKEVDSCKEWIKRWVYPRKTINTKRGSYNLKGLVEKEMSIYISNGAFIKAAIEMGYKFKETSRESKNAYFNMSFNNLKG